MPEGFDFDPRDSNLRMGIEVEYPGRSPGDELYVARGRGTSGLADQIRTWPSSIGGRATYDGTVGLEVVSDRLHPADAPQWYEATIEHVTEEWDTAYQPVGLMRSGSTAGMHIHLSPLSSDQARRLYDISQEPWAKVLFCSSIANSGDSASWPVFRGGRYCRMNYSNNRYSCVNHRGGDHYEWRLPEPVALGHMEIIVKFLRIFEDSPDEAVRYAQAILDEGDDRITAIKRAEAAGMDIDTVPTIEREPAPEDDYGFFEEVADRWDAPEIHHVRMDDSSFYVFDSSLDGTFEIDGHEVNPGEPVWADSINPVNDEEVSDTILRAFNRRGTSEERHTEATEELKKIIKKKKGKA